MGTNDLPLPGLLSQAVNEPLRRFTGWKQKRNCPRPREASRERIGAGMIVHGCRRLNQEGKLPAGGTLPSWKG